MGSVRQSPSDKVNGSVLILPKFVLVCSCLILLVTTLLKLLYYLYLHCTVMFILPSSYVVRGGWNLELFGSRVGLASDRQTDRQSLLKSTIWLARAQLTPTATQRLRRPGAFV